MVSHTILRAPPAGDRIGSEKVTDQGNNLWLASRTESLHDVVLVGFPQNQLNPLEVVVTPLNQARFALLCIALVVCKSLYGLLYYTTSLWCTRVHATGDLLLGDQTEPEHKP